MATYNKFQQFLEDVFEGVYNCGTDQFVVALSVNATPPIATNAVLADLTEVAYTNLSTRNITTNTSAQTSGTYELNLTDLVLTATGAVATFRWVTVYDDTPTSPANPLVSYFDYGSDVTLADTETFTIDFDDTNGLFQAV